MLHDLPLLLVLAPHVVADRVRVGEALPALGDGTERAVPRVVLLDVLPRDHARVQDHVAEGTLEFLRGQHRRRDRPRPVRPRRWRALLQPELRESGPSARGICNAKVRCTISHLHTGLHNNSLFKFTNSGLLLGRTEPEFLGPIAPLG